MASSSNSNSSQYEFNLSLKIDRQVYTILAINIDRDPMEVLLIMAFWLWLQRLGFRNIVSRIFRLPVFLINELADEAMQALGCIVSYHPPTFPDDNNHHIIPLTQTLIKNELSLEFLYANRHAALEGVRKVYNDVCLRVVVDIILEAKDRLKTLPSPFPPFSSTTVNHEDLMTDQGPLEERTMFVTFSKGYPLHEREVREFFTTNYGRDCIETLQMQEVELDEQALCAYIVFRSVTTIDLILEGEQRKKFTFNGKDIWARKFIRKPSGWRPPPAPPCLPVNNVGK